MIKSANSLPSHVDSVDNEPHDILSYSHAQSSQLTASVPVRELHQPMALRICLLGSFSISLDEQAMPLPMLVTARSLLAYILFHPQRIHARTKLLGLFWPDMPEKRARHALSQTIWHIRKVLPTLVASDRTSIWLSDAHTLSVDAAIFDHAIESFRRDPAHGSRDQLRQVLRLYKGELLEGYYDDWIMEPRERLSEKFRWILEQLLQLEKAAGCYESALELALQLSNSDPLNEATHCEIMRLYYVSNRPEAAMAHYRKCTDLLLSELQCTPGPEVVGLAREIARRGHQSESFHLPNLEKVHAFDIIPVAQTTFQPPLIGRDLERKRLLNDAASLFSGSGGIILVEGEVGVGKTRLMQEVARDLIWRGAEVLLASSKENSRTSAYGLLSAILAQGLTPLRVEQLTSILDRSWLSILQPLLPVLQSMPVSSNASSQHTAASHPAIAQAMTHLLSAWSRITPLVLMLDDIQCADEETMRVLQHAASHLRTWSVVIIAAYECTEARIQPSIWDQLQAVDQAGIIDRLTLGGLTLDSTAELIKQSLGSPTQNLVSYVHASTQGNPWLILETLRQLLSENKLRRDRYEHWDILSVLDLRGESSAKAPGLLLPPSVAHCLHGRLAALAPEQKKLLEIVAVLDRHATFNLICAMSTIAMDAILCWLRELVNVHMLIEMPEVYSFANPNDRALIYAQISPDECTRLHRAAAQLLKDQHPEELELLAHYFTIGEVWEQSLYYHWKAGDALRTTSMRLARKHYHAAIKLVKHAQAQLAPELFFELVATYEATVSSLGDVDAQAQCLQVMAEAAGNDGNRLSEVQRRRASLLMRQAQAKDAIIAANNAVAIAHQNGTPTTLIAAMTTLGSILVWQGNYTQAIPILQETIAQSEQVVPPPNDSNAEAHFALALALYYTHDYAGARAEGQTALTSYKLHNNKASQVKLQLLLGCMFTEEGLTAEAQECYCQAITMACGLEPAVTEAYSLIAQARMLILDGRIHQALQCYSQTIAIASMLQDLQLEAWAQFELASISYHFLGESDRVVTSCNDAIVYARQANDGRLEGRCLFLLGEIASRYDDPAVARRYLERAFAILESLAEFRYIPRICLAWARLDVREHNYVRALDRLTYAATICQRTGMTPKLAHVLAERGVILLAMGQLDPALDCTTQAVASLPAGVEQPYLIQFAHFQALVAANQTSEALATLEHTYLSLMKSLDGLPLSQKHQSLTRVPEHQKIVGTWQNHQPTYVTVPLPRKDAPLGRGLHDDEWIQVTWTITAPDDKKIANKVARRHHRLRRLLHEAAAQEAAPTYDQLAIALRVSLRTIEQDMSTLRKQYADLPSTRGKTTA